MLRISSTAGLCLLAMSFAVVAQAPLDDEAAAVERRARTHLENDQWLQAEKAYLDALKAYEKRLAVQPQADSLLLRWCRCRNDLGEVQFRLLKLADARANFATTSTYLKQVVPLRPKEPAFRLELAKTQLLLASGCQHLQLYNEAEAQQHAAVEALRALVKDFPANPEHRLVLAQALKNDGVMLTGLARYQDAQHAYAEATTLAQKLTTEAPGTPEYALHLGLIYSSHAFLLRESGQVVQAVETLRSAAQLLAKLEIEYPNRPEYWFPLPAIYRYLAQPLISLNRASEAEAASKEASRIEIRLAQSPANAWKWHADVSKLTCSLIGSEAERLSKTQQDDVESLLKQSLENALPPSATAFVHLRVAALFKARAQPLAARGQAEEARQLLKQAIELIDKSRRRHPDLPILGSTQADLYVNLAAVELRDGAAIPGDRNLRQAAALLHELAQAQPDAPSFRFQIGDDLMRIAVVLNSLKRFSEGVKYWTEAQVVHKELSDAYPKCPLYRRLHAQGQAQLFRMLAADRAEAPAEVALREGIRLWGQVCADFPATDDFQKSRANDMATLGQYFLQQGRAQEAHDLFAAVRAIMQKLFEQHPRDADYHIALARAHRCMAQVHEKQGNYLEMINDDAKAIALWDSANRLNPRNRQSLAELREAHVHRGAAELKIGKQAEYFDDVERAKTLSEMLDAPLFRLCRIEERGKAAETLQVALVEADDLFQNVDLTGADWQRLALFYVELGDRTANARDKDSMFARAVVALDQAMQKGMPRAQLRQDARLQSLAARTDFRQLMSR